MPMNNKIKTRTVLIVEDEAIIAIITAKTVKGFGYETASASSGERAVDYFMSGNSADLVLMDIDLGDGIDGTEAARRILELVNVPVIFHTAHSEQDMVERVKGITRYGYVIKSSGDFVLNSSIEMAFELFEAHRNLESAMNTIRESEEKYRAAFMTSPDAININMMDGRYVDINDGFTRLTGYTRDDVLEKVSIDLKIWRSSDDRQRLLDELSSKGVAENLEFVFGCKDGSTKTALMSARIIKINNEPHILSITRDITDRKEYEDQIKTRSDELAGINEELVSTIEELESTNEEFEAVNEEFAVTNRELIRKEDELRHEQDFINSLIDSLPGIFYLYSCPELRLRRWNRNHEEMFGFNADEIRGRHITEWFDAGYSDLVIRKVEAIINGDHGLGELHIKKKDGTEIPMLMTGVRFESEGVVYLMGVGFDISETKILEKERARFLDIIERSLNEIYIFDSEHLKFKYINRGALGNLGYTLDEMRSLTPLDIKPEFTMEGFNELVNPLKRGETERLIFHTLHKRKDGSTYNVEVFLQLIKSGGEELFLAVINDITARKMIEDALYDSEERYRTLVETLPDGVVIHRKNRIIYANDGASKILRAKGTDRLNGLAVTDFILSCDSSNQTESGVSKTAGTKKLIYCEGEAKTFDGKSIKVSRTDIPFRFSGKPATLTIFNDISGRIEAEMKIGSLLSEKELLHKEVHHRIKNNMNTIKGLLALQSYTLKEPLAVSALQDAESRVQCMMLLYDKLYCSDDFRALPLKEYLPALVDEIAANYLIHDLVRVETDVEDFIINAKILFPLGIIVNELVTNALKYAFTGRDSGLITVSAHKENGKARITISDNGVGVPEDVNMENTSGFGLQLTGMLVEQIGGSIKLVRGSGTEFIIEFNLK